MTAMLLRLAAAAVLVAPAALHAQTAPEPREIPLPPIASHTPLPASLDFPATTTPPDPLAGVRTPADWSKRRAYIRATLAHFATGEMPPAPRNLKAETLKTELVLDGAVRYRLVRLTFGPGLSLNVGVFTPANLKGPFPTIIWQSNTPPGAPELARQFLGPTQGTGADALLPPPDSAAPPKLPHTMPAQTAEQIAHLRAEVFRRGYALAVYNPNDCAEDTTLRAPDGSFAFRHSRFPAAYPDYDWGVLAAWAWGASRIADFLDTQPEIDHHALWITGASRWGKSSLIAAAFDDRLHGAPVVTGGLGIGSLRLAGAEGSESFDTMVKKYPNWFAPAARGFRGRTNQLPFDENWFLALAAPHPFIALEGDADVISLPIAVQSSIEAARPVYTFLHADPLSLGVHYSHHAHAFTDEDWTALMDFSDKYLLHKPSDKTFNTFLTPEQRKAAIAAATKQPSKPIGTPDRQGVPQ